MLDARCYASRQPRSRPSWLWNIAKSWRSAPLSQRIGKSAFLLYDELNRGYMRSLERPNDNPGGVVVHFGCPMSTALSPLSE